MGIDLNDYLDVPAVIRTKEGDKTHDDTTNVTNELVTDNLPELIQDPIKNEVEHAFDDLDQELNELADLRHGTHDRLYYLAELDGLGMGEFQSFVRRKDEHDDLDFER